MASAPAISEPAQASALGVCGPVLVSAFHCPCDSASEQSAVCHHSLREGYQGRLHSIPVCNPSSSAMLRLTLLCFLLACAVSLSSSVEILENGIPLLWSQTMGQVSELPSQAGIMTPSPLNHLHRLSLSRLMIDATNPFMLTMGPDASANPLWALALQLVWMHTSGRLADPTGATSCGKLPGDVNCIAPESWWGCVNYHVSVLPFISATQNGFMGEGAQVQMMMPEDNTDYCTTYADCSARHPDAMAKWDAFFQGLITTGASALSDTEKKDAILGLFWDAQMASVQASSVCDNRKTFYSSKEVSFANSWLYIFDYLSAVYFQSNLEDSAKFITSLPSRVLTEEDNAPKIPDLSKEENHSLYIFSWLESINSIMGGTLAQAWKRAMCSAELREKGRDMMVQLVLNPSFPTTSFMTIISGAAAYC
ncbi:protein LEG1 homolog [Cheilinus undulatus]|uniref:protein LEG1 homolog n=1 Tax=Cheilinus undulatus TaxID=241271 RepID=UPI001BD210EB|nr:protein LEG1 homolog [Cheilinus undulatus]